MQEFKDRVAVVTGAASGMGLAMARRFATEGMAVVLAVLNGADAEIQVAIRANGSGSRCVSTRRGVGLTPSKTTVRLDLPGCQHIDGLRLSSASITVVGTLTRWAASVAQRREHTG